MLMLLQMPIFLLVFKQKFLYMYNPKNLAQCFSLLHLEPEAAIFFLFR